MEELDKIMEHLRAFEPQLKEREQFREAVIKKISSSKSGLDFVFGWTEIVWLRRTMALTSLAIILAFVSQQLFLVNRISELEKRMISINTDKVLEYQRENVMANSVLFSDLDRKGLNDSIKVATGDLLDLVKSYRALQKKYEEIHDRARTDNLEINKKKL